MTLYYDPLLDVHHLAPAFTAVINTIYLAPQVPEDAMRLFDAALEQNGILTGDGPVVAWGERATAIALLVARDAGRTDLAARLQAGCEAAYEPTWSGDEFWWGFGLDEPYPRGQWNAILAAAEVATPAAWSGLANEYTPYSGPELRGVDLDLIGIRQAAWLDGRLLIATAAASAATEGTPTRMRVTGLADPTHAVVTGTVAAQVEGTDLVLDLHAGPHTITVAMP